MAHVSKHNMVIYRDVYVPYVKKDGKVYAGDVPVSNWNSITKKNEPVVNTRGKAYAARNRLSYRNSKKNDD